MQKQQLDLLLAISRDTAALLSAAADTESATARRAVLETAAAQVQAAVASVLRSRATWQAHFGSPDAETAAPLTPADVAALRNNAEVRHLSMRFAEAKGVSRCSR